MYSKKLAIATYRTDKYLTISPSIIQGARDLVKHYYDSNLPFETTVLTLTTLSILTSCILTTPYFCMLLTNPHDSKQQDGYRI